MVVGEKNGTCGYSTKKCTGYTANSCTFELAQSSSTAPLAQDETVCFTVERDEIGVDSATFRIPSSNRLKNRANKFRNEKAKKPTRTSLLLKPSVWSRLWRISMDGISRINRFPIPWCKNGKISPIWFKMFGIFLCFILIISAFLLGRFLSGNINCPSSSKIDNQDSSRALLRDRLSQIRKSKISNHVSPIIRLPRHLIPLHYDLHLDFTELHTKIVTGNIGIHMECHRSIGSFLIHASHQHLKISNIFISRSIARNSILVINWNETDQWTGGDGFSTINITLGSNLLSGVKYHLNITFTTIICNTKSGVTCFEDGQPNQNGHSAIFVSTKFEPTAARTLIPCFDEPDLKATFNVSVIRHSDMTVITNGRSWKRVRTRRGQVMEYFERTPRMSTYLLGFVIGPYVRREKRLEHGTTISIWTRREDRSKGEFALEYASRMLRLMENYFNINYILPKLDLVASPNYPVGAMENWGLLIFHQRALLYLDEYRLIEGNPNGHQLYQPYLLPKFRTSKIIIHELLHQWFGNLVTMDWWSEIWLNEGFATFYIYQFLKDEYPVLTEFHQIWKLISTWQRETASSIWLDPNQPDRYSLVRNFSHDEDLYEAFDEYHLYSKGGAIVRMIWHLLGEEAVRDGLQQYLLTNSFGSVNRWELWNHMKSDTTSNGTQKIELGQLMESWLTNPGFPEIIITRGQNGIFQIEQGSADIKKHCSYLPIHFNQNETKMAWSIPVSFITEENIGKSISVGPFWINNRSHTISDISLKSNQWILINPQFKFPFRINYDLENWSKLIRQLRNRPDSVPVQSRVQLIADAGFFLKENEHFPYFLDLLGYLRNEMDLLPLILGIHEIYSILDQYKASSIYPLLVFYFRPIIEQASKIRTISEREAELDAVWFLEDSFPLTLKLLQCTARHRRCRVSREEVQSVLSLPSNGQITDKLIPICEYLRRNFTNTERRILLYWLDQQESRMGMESNRNWRQDVIFMISCVNDAELIKRLVDIALARGDMELLASTLSSTFTLNYNDLLATEIWSRLSNTTIGNSVDHSQIEVHLQNMLKSVGTLSQLKLAQRSLSAIHFEHLDEISFIEARLTWREKMTPSLEDWLMERLELTLK